MWSLKGSWRVPSVFDDGAVDLDAAFEDDLLGLAAAGDAGLREDLLEAVAGGFGVVGCGGRGGLASLILAF